MTDLLHDMLRARAAGAPPPLVDVDGVVRAGDRRIRRRRMVVGSAAAAVAVLVAGGTVAVPSLLTATDAPPAAPASPFEQRRVGYAVGQVIHWGEDSFRLDRRVTAYVQTDDGFVYVDPRDDVWFFDGTRSERIGHTENGRLRADDAGSLVAWVGADESGDTQYVVHDTRLGTAVARVDGAAAGPSREETDRAAEVFAVDDGSVYWRADAHRLVRYQVSSGDSEVLYEQRPPADPAAKQPVVHDIADVAEGQVAYLVDAGRGAEAKVARTLDVDAPTVAAASNVLLSPDGGYLAAEEDDNIRVYDSRTGADVTPDLARYPFAVAYGWVDPDTAMVLALRRLDGPAYDVDLLACVIPTDSCAVTASTTVGADHGELVLPVGDPMDT